MSIKCKKSQLCDIIKREQPLVSLPTYICSRFEDRCCIDKMSTIINDEWKKSIHDFQGPVSIVLTLVFKDYNGSVKWKKWKTKLHSSQCLACTGFDLPESPPICCVLQASEINTLVRLGNYRPSGPPVPFSPLEHNSQCVISHFLVSPQLNPNATLNFSKFADLKRL